MEEVKKYNCDYCGNSFPEDKGVFDIVTDGPEDSDAICNSCISVHQQQWDTRGAS